MKCLSKFSDILLESNTWNWLVALQNLWKRVLNCFRFMYSLLHPGLMTRILVRVLVGTLFSCIMLSSPDTVSCRQLWRCLLPKLSWLVLVIEHKRFNSVTSCLESLVFGNIHPPLYLGLHSRRSTQTSSSSYLPASGGHRHEGLALGRFQCLDLHRPWSAVNCL